MTSFVLLYSSSTFSFDFSFWYQRNGTEAVKAIKNINTWWVDGDKKDWLLDVIRDATNWILGILALIALIILIYGWFLMLTSAGDDDKYGKWWSVMKSALTWLVIIGLARFVVSLVIWLSQSMTRWVDGANSNQ